MNLMPGGGADGTERSNQVVRILCRNLFTLPGEVGRGSSPQRCREVERAQLAAASRRLGQPVSDAKSLVKAGSQGGGEAEQRGHRARGHPRQPHQGMLLNRRRAGDESGQPARRGPDDDGPSRRGDHSG